MKNARSKPKKEWGNVFEWLRGVLGGEEAEWIERDQEKWVRNHAECLNRNFISLDGLKAIEI